MHRPITGKLRNTVHLQGIGNIGQGIISHVLELLATIQNDRGIQTILAYFVNQYPDFPKSTFLVSFMWLQPNIEHKYKTLQVLVPFGNKLGLSIIFSYSYSTSLNKNKPNFGSQTFFARHWIFLPYVGSFCHLLDLFATLLGP